MQYASTLEWLKTRLPMEGFEFRTISGSMTLKKRAEVGPDLLPFAL